VKMPRKLPWAVKSEPKKEPREEDDPDITLADIPMSDATLKRPKYEDTDEGDLDDVSRPTKRSRMTTFQCCWEYADIM
jgi:hypothetical protein